jgi:hypothetical protein
MARAIEINWRPDERTLRRFGWIALFVFTLLAGAAWRETWLFAAGLGRARTAVAIVLAACALWSALSSAFYPRANRLLFVALSVIGYPIGLVVSYLVLAILFFGVFAPVGIALRLLGRDPMQRALIRKRSSYWQKARPARRREDYFKQF